MLTHVPIKLRLYSVYLIRVHVLTHWSYSHVLWRIWV